MFGTPLCDELRGYLDVKVPSAARKKGLLLNWKAWRRRWLVVRRFLVSSDPSLASGEVVAFLGRRLEVKLIGDDSDNVSAPCPVVVVEEWQEDALVCPTKSRSHPYAFGIFPQPGCEPVLFLSGRSAEESRRWLASIRSLLVPPFRPHSCRLSSLLQCPGDDAKMPLQHSSFLSTSPEICQLRSTPSKSQHICFPPLPPLPSRCRLRRRSSLESLSAPSLLMDRRRSLSDSEIASSISSSDRRQHRHHKCQTVISGSERTKNVMLNEDYDHHIYAGIEDSGVCSSLSNDSRSCLSSSSSSSCSSSSGLYAYASGSANGLSPSLREKTRESAAEANVNVKTQPKLEETSLLRGRVASILVSAGIGLVFSTPVPLEGVPELPGLSNQTKEVDIMGTSSKQEGEMDTDRRESIASGIYEEIQDNGQPTDASGAEDVFSFLNEETESGPEQAPPPLPPRSPSQYFSILNGRQKDLAWFLGVHRESNSCPASDVEDDEPSRDSSPINGQDVVIRKPRRKISEPSGNNTNLEGRETSRGGYSRRRKNLETFLGVMEFGSRAKEMSKSGANFLNKSLGTLEVSGGIKGEKDYADKPQEYLSRERTYTDSAGTKLNNLFTNVKESKSCGGSADTLTKIGSKLTDGSAELSGAINQNADFDELYHGVDMQNEEGIFKTAELQENELDKESYPLSKLVSPSFTLENFDVKEDTTSAHHKSIERCHSFSCSSLKVGQTNKSDNSDKSGQSPKSPRSIAKRMNEWVKPNLMKLLLKEQNRQQEIPRLRDKTKQVINRSLETLGWLSLATNQFEDDASSNLTVGGSSFYRSATCTGVEMQNERHNAIRRGAGGLGKDESNYSKSYESMTLDRRRPSRKIPSMTISSKRDAREIEDGNISLPLQLLEESAICPYHKTQLMKSGEIIGHSLEDIERLAKQELICEQICMSNKTNYPDYMPMMPLKSKGDQEKFTCSPIEVECQSYKRVSVVPEEDHYMSMEGVKTTSCSQDQKECTDELLHSVPLENSTNPILYTSDGDIYMSMEGRKTTQEELAQR